jgi:hypothetical protein
VEPGVVLGVCNGRPSKGGEDGIRVALVERPATGKGASGRAACRTTSIGVILTSMRS